MYFYSDKSVYEAAVDRIEYILREFPDRKVVVDFSGGKDSTVTLHLTKEAWDRVGRAGRIPVMFLDQEAEAPQTVEYVREVMSLPWVEPFWIQSFFKEWNASEGQWFNCWGIGEKWCREKEPGNPCADLTPDVLENFPDVLDSFHRLLFGDDYVALGGVRIQESPARRLGLTQSKCYKDITWGKCPSKNALVFYPIWDWNTNDVWYYIFSNRFHYNKLYNYWMTKRPLVKCRVSSFIHENSIQSLKEIKEVSPEFYTAALKRIANINTTVQAYDKMVGFVGVLPPYFKDWPEYVHYLNEHLVASPESRKSIASGYEAKRRRWHRKFGHWQQGIDLAEETIGQATAQSIVAEDFELTKVENVVYGMAGYYKRHQREIEAFNAAWDAAHAGEGQEA